MTQKLLQLATLTVTREAAAHAHEQSCLVYCVTIAVRVKDRLVKENVTRCVVRVKRRLPAWRRRTAPPATVHKSGRAGELGGGQQLGLRPVLESE